MRLPASSQEWTTIDKSRSRDLHTRALQVLWQQHRDHEPTSESAELAIELSDALGLPQPQKETA